MRMINEKISKSRHTVLADFAYAVGYFAAVATLIKFGWWIWQQPW